MRIFVDTEFYEAANAGVASIQLISIGLVRDDGETYYAENAGFDWSQVPGNHWLQGNVRPHLNPREHAKHVYRIQQDILAFVGSEPKFYGWYCDYDWVVLCSIFGRMVDLPSHFPMYCNDLRQLAGMIGFHGKSVPQDESEHNALNDAKWNADVFAAMTNDSAYFRSLEGLDL